MFKTAVFVDGRFFLKRIVRHSDNLAGLTTENAINIANLTFDYCKNHAIEPNRPKSNGKGYLYRIFFYDCPPLAINAANPLNKRTFDYKKTDIYAFTNALHAQLRKKRKLALRLGRLDAGNWSINKKPLRRLVDGEINVADLAETDFTHEIRQKEIDVKIGVDIASVAFKKQVERIVLITGDSDFVPAAKLARREGVDFILDNMGMQVSDGLFEHVDGLENGLNLIK